jgi:UDP-GlcNAc:undecaprenyl-phosphate/decaprenyl-phosphate GlcNAc-1-phosphate transferase
MSSPRAFERLAVRNHRGVLVPRTLGFIVVGGVLIGLGLQGLLDSPDAFGWAVAVAVVIVGAAGLVDDLAGGPERGLRGHLAALKDGQVTTGIGKAVLTVGAAALVAAVAEDRSVSERLALIVTLAGCANVWNGLDVRPGRAIKVFLLPALAFGVAADPLAHGPVLGAIVVALVVLPYDLAERAMLGDAGANALGFLAGVMVVELLDGPWVWAGAVVAVALNVVAETVTFSRVIDVVPALRWVDRLGRRA